MSIVLVGFQKLFVRTLEVLVTQNLQRWLDSLSMQKLRIDTDDLVRLELVANPVLLEALVKLRHSISRFNIPASVFHIIPVLCDDELDDPEAQLYNVQRALDRFFL